ncbi:hypothetical protein D3C78_1436150 [compost metagenome]
MAFDVLIGHFQRIEGQVSQYHFGVREHFGTDDANAAGTGAQVENAGRLSSEPRLETLFDQLANGRTWNQHALVDNEGQATEPRLTQQVGGRHAVFDAAFEQALQVHQFIVFQLAIQIAVGNLPRQVDRTQHQQPGFIPGVVGAVSEK